MQFIVIMSALMVSLIFDGMVEAFVPRDLDPKCMYPVCITVRVENDRSDALQNPSRHVLHGILLDVMRPVAAHSQETFFLRNREWSAKGVDGVFVYETSGRQIIIFLSAPLPFRKQANRIGIAITKKGLSDKSEQNLTFLTKERDVEGEFDSWAVERFADTSKWLVARAGGITVHATMGTGPVTEAIVKVT